MDPRIWMKPWSRLFKGNSVEVGNPPSTCLFCKVSMFNIRGSFGFVNKTSSLQLMLACCFDMHVVLDWVSPPTETPDLYLKLATRCMEQVNRLCPTRGSPLPKFNQEQCKYLAIKLQLAIQSANSIIKDVNKEFLSLAHPKEMEQLLEIFKFLHAMGVEVEGLIQNCCKEAWIQSAIMLSDTLELVATIGLNLEFCTNIFSAKQSQRRMALTRFDATRIREAEVQIVKEKVDLDGMKLIMDLRNGIESNAFSSVELQLATFLLGRLETVMLPLDINSPRSEERVLPPMITSSHKILGKGSFAIVYKAKWCGVEVAKKTFYGPPDADFCREVSILDGLNHPNIVSLLGSWTDEKKCHLVMELMDGDLFTLMQQRMQENGNQGSPFNIQEALDLILQIGEGMLFLHEKSIVHRDLKSHNILFRFGKVAKETAKYLHVKVADFGLSKTKEHNATYSKMTMNVGTRRWMAPEVMKDGNVRSDDVDEERETMLNYPFKIDIYSFGMVCYEILTGEEPFLSLKCSDVKKAVLSGDRPPLPRECPDRLKTLIESCWSAEASTRPSFGNICEELRVLKYSNLQIYWKATIYRCPLEDIMTIDELVAKLSNPVTEVQQIDANGIHQMVNRSLDHRIYIKEQGAMLLLVALYYSGNLKARERAITTLQALSVVDRELIIRRDSLKELSLRQNTSSVSSLSKEIYLGSAVGPIVEVLKVGRMKARENAAQALANLSSDLGGKVRMKIRNSGAVPALVTLLEDGSTEGKEYAAIVLFRTCHSQEDYASAAQAGIIPPLMNLIAQQSSTMLDDALVILARLTKVRESLIAIAAVEPIPVLVKSFASESGWNKDRAALILRRLCLHDPRFIKEARESNVVEPLTHFAQHPLGSSSPKRSARALLQLLQKREEKREDDLQL